MSEKEIDRLQIMTQLEKKQLTQKQAGDQLGLSVRQVKRLVRKYKSEGPGGLINKSRGKPSHNRLSEQVKQKALDLIVERYRIRTDRPRFAMHNAGVTVLENSKGDLRLYTRTSRSPLRFSANNNIKPRSFLQNRLISNISMPPKTTRLTQTTPGVIPFQLEILTKLFLIKGTFLPRY